MAIKSTYYGLLKGVRDEVERLCSTGVIADVRPENVLLRKIPYFVDLLDDPEAKLPAIIVAPTNSRLSLHGGTNEREDRGYPVFLAYGSLANPRLSEDFTVSEFEPTLLWKEKVINEFIGMDFEIESPSRQFHEIIIEDGIQIDWSKLLDDSMNVSWVGLRFVTRQSRGN